LKEPFRVEGFDDIPLSVTASIGIATNERDEPDDLLRDAAIALCSGKGQGRNRHVRFESAMKTAAMERLELETDLREALQENQFFLVYEPIFEARQRSGSGAWRPSCAGATQSGASSTPSTSFPCSKTPG